MPKRSHSPRRSVWRSGSRGLLLVATLGAFLLCGTAIPAQASAANVVPNPGFEQGGCGGNTAVICGWVGPTGQNVWMEQASGGHSGTASMGLWWGGGEGASGGTSATTDPAFCSAIGPGAHPESFWYYPDLGLDGYGGVTGVSMQIAFYPGADCTGTPSSSGYLSQTPPWQEWTQVSGVAVAPPGTQSALVSVAFDAYCSSGTGYSGCTIETRFDDIDVEDAVVTTPAINSFTPTHGLVGTSVDILGANFNGATSVTFNGTAAIFTVNSDTQLHATVPSGATTGPISVTTPQGTGTTNDGFHVDAPEIGGYTPSQGPVGTLVDIGGHFFTGATSVTFNGKPAPYTVDSDWELHATVPSGATTGLISVTTPSGSGRSSGVFTVMAPPTARFSLSCTTLTCSFDGSASSGGDGTIQSYSWNFGDGTSGSGATTTHSYMLPGDHVVTLTVTDNDGATASDSKSLTLISLRVSGYKQRGLEKVDLSWSGAAGANFDVYRNAGKIATVQAAAYTDNLNTKGSGTYAYKVCAASICSNTASVTF